jgi:hypothetical protein
VTASTSSSPNLVSPQVSRLPDAALNLPLCLAWLRAHAAYGRGAGKDWHDIACVVLHNDDGGPTAAAEQVQAVFGADLVGQTATALAELAANFVDATSQGSLAYAQTMAGFHPDLDFDVLANDAVGGIALFAGGDRALTASQG